MKVFGVTQYDKKVVTTITATYVSSVWSGSTFYKNWIWKIRVVNLFLKCIEETIKLSSKITVNKVPPVESLIMAQMLHNHEPKLNSDMVGNH